MNVKFKFQNDQILEIMAKADCLIVPSLCYENSPTVIYEAAYNNLPVLAANIGGISELLSMTGGISYEPSDYLDLEKKMQWAYYNATAWKVKVELATKRFIENAGQNTSDYIVQLTD